MGESDSIQAGGVTTETLALGTKRLRFGCVAMAILKPLFLPLYYIVTPQVFPSVLKLIAGIVVICVITYYLSFRNRPPYYYLGVFLSVSCCWIIIVTLLITGGSRSQFFPILLMCIIGVGFIAPWGLRYSFITFGLISGFYLIGILLFDKDINYGMLAINTMALVDAAALGTIGISSWEKIITKEFRKRLMAHKDKEDLCRWLHDSLGSDLYNIILLSEFTQQKDLKCSGIAQRLALISEISRKGVENIRDFLYCVDKEERTLDTLIDCLKDYGKRISGGSDVEFILTQDIPSGSYTLSPTHIFNIYLIYKEAITNIVKHAKAKKINVAITHYSKRLELSIKDDGIGFDLMTIPPNCYGIKNMKARAEELKGKLDITSLLGKGTEINLSVPLI